MQPRTDLGLLTNKTRTGSYPPTTHFHVYRILDQQIKLGAG